MGKHSKPKERSRVHAIASTATVGAVATGALLLPSGVAHAAPDSAWDALAECESSGNWSANTGNGYFGGLQFLPSTWRAFGGTGNPASASRSEQIRVAERTLKAQGWNAWPVCSREAGVRSYSPAVRSEIPQATSKSISPSISAPKATNVPKQRKPKHELRRSGQTATPLNYTIKSGDTLVKIARAEGVQGGWRALYAANKTRIVNPHKIYVGQRIHVPS